jgi:hypothetical protein
MDDTQQIPPRPYECLCLPYPQPTPSRHAPPCPCHERWLAAQEAQREQDRDPLGPAKGILLAVGLGALVWVGLFWLLVGRH